MRRIGVLMGTAADDAEGQARLTAFVQRLGELGWTIGRNVRFEYRWSAGAPDRVRSYATELVALAPDVIATSGASYVAALQQATRTVPIVFAMATDPVGGGLVASLARPGGNVTATCRCRRRPSTSW
jgi:putative tryptophan/tyrosine transport system substrate-binding protein